MKIILWICVFVIARDLAYGTVGSETLIQKVQSRINRQEIRIDREFKAGKLTKDQAKALKTQLESIRQREIADLKLNGTKTLTPEQLADLNKKLDELSKSIPLK